MFEILRNPDQQSVDTFQRICEGNPKIAVIVQMIFGWCNIQGPADIPGSLREFQNLRPTPGNEDVWSEHFQNSDLIQTNLNFILKQPPVLEAFGPPPFAALFQEVTSEDSADRRTYNSTTQMHRDIQNLPPSLQKILKHYASYANPTDPAAAVRDLCQRWPIDPELQPAAPQAAEGQRQQPTGSARVLPPPRNDDDLPLAEERQQHQDGPAGDRPNHSYGYDSQQEGHDDMGDPDSPTARSHSTANRDTATENESGQDTDDHMGEL